MTATKPFVRQRVQLESASREAEGYLELGMHAAALRALQRRGKLVHADGHACYLLGESLRELSRFREAIYPLRRSVALDPQPAEPWLALGWCYKRIDQLGEASRAIEAALERHPDDALLSYNLACYYSLAGRNLESLRRLRRALRIDPNLRELVEAEPDFRPMHFDPGFQMLIAATA